MGYKKMTKERLEEYRSNKQEIEELQYALEHLADGDKLIGNDVIMDYRSGYGMPQSIVGFNTELYERREKRYTNLKYKLENECDEVEEFVNSIKDSLLRRIFRLRYIEGLTQAVVARKLHIDQSRISRKIDNFLKVA